MNHSNQTIVRKKVKKFKYRWKAMGFSSSRKYQEFLQQFKQEQCELCGLDRRLHSFVYGYDITIHHIDEDRNNNHPHNLQTLCCRCHSEIDPSFHNHFSKMLAKKRRKR